MRSEIVPRLLRDVPGQPSDAELEADNFLYRFRALKRPATFNSRSAANAQK